MAQGWFFDHRADVPNKMLYDKDGLISEHIFNLASSTMADFFYETLQKRTVINACLI